MTGKLNKSKLKFNFVSDLFVSISFSRCLVWPGGMNSHTFILFISLDLPDEGFTINRNLQEDASSSFTQNPFPDVISQVSNNFCCQQRTFGRLNWRYLIELQTKVIRKFAKISQSRRRPLLGPSSG